MSPMHDLRGIVTPLRGIAALAFLFFGALVAAWPDWTLRYVQALAWPVVALIAVAAFGPALARRVPALSALHLPGGVVATFALEQHAFDFGELDLSELLGADIAVDEVDGVDADHDERLAQMTFAFEVSAAIIGAFQMQLDFLTFLQGAPDGLTHLAAQGWFINALDTRGITDRDQWNPDQLVGWLQAQRAITLTPDATYVLAPHGHGMLTGIQSGDLFIAPKAI
jgi:hypothetical protein